MQKKSASAGTKPKMCPACGQMLEVSPDQVQAMLDQLPPRAFVRAKLLLHMLPFSEATLWRKVAKGEFPKPAKISERITGWRLEEVRAWFIEKGFAQ